MAYLDLAKENMQAAERHLQRIRAMLRHIIEDCVAADVFRERSTDSVVDVIELLAADFTNPWRIAEHRDGLTPQTVAAAIRVIVAGLRPSLNVPSDA